jgi:putative spermidine/putrescine transport system permease protein
MFPDQVNAIAAVANRIGDRRRTGRTERWAWVTLPYAAILILLFVIPVSFLVRQSLVREDGTFTLANYESVLLSRASVAMLRTTFEMTAVVTIGCLILGFCIAYAIRSLSGALRSVVIGCVIAPFFVTVTVRVFGWFALTAPPSPLASLLTMLTGTSSLRGTAFAVVSLAMMQIMMPFAVLPIASSLSKLDPRIERSALALGADRWRLLSRILLPLSVPGLLTGGILVFAQTISAFFVPDILGGGFVVLLGNVVVNNISFTYNPHEAAAAALILAITSLMVIWVAVKMTWAMAGIYRGQRRTPADGSARHATPSAPAPTVSGPVVAVAPRASASRSRVTRRRIAFQLLVAVSVLIGIAIMVIPLAMTIILAASSGPLLTFPIPGLSVMPYVNVLGYPGYVEAVVRSVGLAMAIVVMAGVIGTVTAIAGRSLTGRSARVFQTAVLAPVVFPSLALGLALFEWFAVIKLRAGLLPLFLGHLVLATPFVIRTVLAGLDHLDPELEKAARSLGARRWYALRRVTLPLLMPSLLSASVFAFWISFDNFTISFFFGSPTTRLVPIQLLVMASAVVDPRLAAGATLLLVVSVPLVLLLRRLSSVQMMRNMW